MSDRKVPKWIQPFVWSVQTDKLDLQKDKHFIIHQLLAYGGSKEWKWLFTTYRQQEVETIFITIPYKDYRAPRFNFIAHYLLGISGHKLDPAHYVKSSPKNT